MSDPFSHLAAALQDRYRLERELGAGGMATVYLAEDLKHDRPVAIKVLRPELAAVIGAERFLAEIRTMASLQHPNILPLFDSGRAEADTGQPGPAEFLFYVMPYVEGETLRDRLTRETRLPIDEAVRITAEVADALEYAHRRGIVHRDIKPENILLQQGRALIADFGIALTAGAADRQRLTETGLLIGTPGYMSPEQALGERALDARSDVFSLGVVLYEAVTGALPFEGPSAQASVAKLLTEGPVPPSRRHPAVPRELDATILAALDKDVNRRTPSAGVLREALVGTSRSGGRRPVSSWRAWMGIGAALATIAGALALLTLTRQPSVRSLATSRIAPDTAAVRLVKVANYWLLQRTQGGCDQAIPRYAEATTRDTAYAAAWAGLANANAICAMFGSANPFNGLVAARAAAEHALALDSSSAIAWTALGMTRLFSEQQWEAARADFERAAALDSTTPWPWLYRTWTLLAVGRIDSAETSMRQAYRRAPTNDLIGARLSQVIALRGNDAEARGILEEGLQRDSNDIPTRYAIAVVALDRHSCADALAGADWLITHHAVQPVETSSAYRMNGALVAAIRARCGRAAEARRYADSVAAREAGGAYVDPWTQVIVYAALGDSARMFAEIETAVKAHNWGLLYLPTEPLLAVYRDMPHFRDLMRRLHEI